LSYSFIITTLVIHSIFGFFFEPSNAVNLEVYPPCAHQRQERDKEWKQNEQGLPRELTIHSRIGIR